MSATNTMLTEPMVAEDLEPTILISADLTCLNSDCVVCGPAAEAVADAAQTNGARGGGLRKAGGS